MTYIIKPNNKLSMKYSQKYVPAALLMLGSAMGLGIALKLYPHVWRVMKNFQQTNFTMPTNMSSMKYALKSVPGLADVGVGPRAPPRCLEESGKTFK